jgi:hypothetical protein
VDFHFPSARLLFPIVSYPDETIGLRCEQRHGSDTLKRVTSWFLSTLIRHRFFHLSRHIHTNRGEQCTANRERGKAVVLDEGERDRPPNRDLRRSRRRRRGRRRRPGPGYELNPTISLLTGGTTRHSSLFFSLFQLASSNDNTFGRFLPMQRDVFLPLSRHPNHSESHAYRAQPSASSSSWINLSQLSVIQSSSLAFRSQPHSFAVSPIKFDATNNQIAGW